MADVANDKMRAAVCCVIIELDEPPSLAAVRRHLFGNLALDADSEEQLRVAHSSQLRIAQLEHCKNAMATAIESDPAAAENRFPSLMSKNAFISDPDAHRLVRALDSDSAETAAILFKELADFRWKLARRTQTVQAEPAFRKALKRWLSSGEPTQEMWQALCRWREDGGGLDAFREHVKAAAERLQGSQTQSLLARMLAAARRLGEFAEFAEIEKIHHLLNQCCAPSLTVEDGGHLRVEGAIVVASLLLDMISLAITEDFFTATILDTDDVLRRISIYATECCSLDTSLDQPLWAGVNLCIVTKRLYIHNDVVIDLSGRSFDARPESDRTAKSAASPDGPGLNGKEGRAGQSSGNLLILASNVIGADRLSVRLNGGRGEDGQHGGDGCNGADGVGVTDDEIRAIDFPGLQRSPEERRELFLEFCPFHAGFKVYDFDDNSGRFISHRRSDTRCLTLVAGTLGGEGSWGGAGGPGGEGGSAGDLKMSNLTETRDWSPGLLSQRMGETGNDGEDGERGARGCDATDAYCYKDFSLAESVVRHSSAGKQFRVEWKEASRFNVPSHYLSIPHHFEFSLFTKTYIVFEEYELERPPLQPRPTFRRAERLRARKNATIMSFTALNRFYQVSINSAYKCAERSSRVKHIGAAQAEAEVTKNCMHDDEVRMVRCKQNYAECSLLCREDNQPINEEIKSRSNFIGRPCNFWTAVKECVQEPTRNNLHEEESRDIFEKDLENMQREVLNLNSELVTELEDFTNCQSSTASAREKILRALEWNTPLQEYADFVITLINSTTFVLTLSRLVDAVDPKRFPITWRTIIDIAWSIDSLSNCNWNFVSLLIATTPLNELLDILITFRIALYTRRLDMLHSMRLREALRLIKSAEAKWLLQLKLEEAEMKNMTLDKIEDTIDLMCHAQDQLRQLADLPIEEWLDTAGRQNWAVADREHFGSAAFYLEMMSRAGFVVEERAMRVILREWRAHSASLFGEVACFIAAKELVADERFFGALLLRVLTDDNDDARIHELLPQAERRLEDMPQLVRGLRDCDEASENRRSRRTKLTIETLRGVTSNIRTRQMVAWLDAFDDALERTKGTRLRDVQRFSVMSALVSGQNLLQQVSTGEGKSFIIAAIAAIRCKLKESDTVDIISSSSVLAQRDATQLRDLYEALDLTVAHNCDESSKERRKAYRASIVYGDIAHFQRDYLLDSFYRKDIRGKRQLDNVIVDEVDSMTLDCGNHVLYISHKVPSLKLLDSLFVFIQRQIHSPQEGEAKTSEEIRIRTLREIYGRLSLKDLESITSDHAEAVFARIVQAGFIDHEGFILTNQLTKLSDLRTALDPILDSESISILVDTLRIEMEREKEIVLPVHMRAFVRLHISTFIENCVQASAMRPDVDYAVDEIRLADGSTEDTVMIIEGDTGTDLASTQWSGGLHQFLQMKHACRVTPMSLKAVFISNVTYLCKYKRLYGLSGTLGSAEESRILADLYKVDLIHIPTHKPRRMIEHVPLLAYSLEDWTKAVYLEVEREIGAHRSVLIICQTIEELKQLHQGLRSFHRKKRESSQAMEDAMATITVYARQRDKFEYQERGLEQDKIILSTNLAGRGTDILLSDGLEKTGGLHVIVAFVPRNQRVEDQAMGRAARCGAPGSGRIIAHIRSASEGTRAPSFHDFKMRRDNAEVFRIQSLQNHFRYRIAVEEGTLKRFGERLEDLDDKLFRAGSAGLPEAEDVIYKALLDNWTLWLDANDRQFNECERARDDRMAGAIIQSVDDFLAAHRIEKADDNVLIVPKWISAGEWLLRLGIIQMSHKKGRSDAERTFHRVIEDGADTAAFAYYYLGCLSMDRFEEMRTEQSSLLLDTPSSFEVDVDGAMTMFARSRVALTLLLERRSADTRFLQLLTGSSSAQCGLQRQLTELTTAVHQIIANIDWLIGEPMSSQAFHPLTACPQQQAQLFETLTMIDTISPPLLGKDVQGRAAFYGTLIQRKFGIDQQTLMRILRDEQAELLRPSDETKGVIDTIERRAVMRGEGSALAKRCHLPSRMDFWRGMHEIGAFYDMQHVYVVKEEAREEVLAAVPIDVMAIDEETARSSVMYSNRAPADFTLYAKSEIDAQGEFKAMRAFVESKKVELDLLARVDSSKMRKPYLPQFDGFTAHQLKEHFGFNDSTCAFVLDHLLTKGVIEREDSEDESVYRQTGPIDCSTLPSALADSIDHFLGHHFAYTFVRGDLSMPSDDTNKVMLPADAYQELFEELTRLEVVSQPRILSNNYGLIDYTDFPFIERRELEQFVHARRMKIKDKIQMFKLVPFTEYLTSRGALANSEMEDLIDLGMVAAVSLRKATRAHKIAGAVFNGCRFVASKGLTSILFITGVVGMVMGAAVHAVGATAVTAAEWSSKMVPGRVAKAIRSSVSKTVDAIEWVPEKISECLVWAGEQMMRGLSWSAGKCVDAMEFLGGKHFERIAEAAKSLGKGIQQSMFYMFAQCRALFGSAEYYNQCRVTAQKIATTSKLTETESRNEFRIARVFHAIGAAVEEQEVQADSREQELIDQLHIVARNLKTAISKVLQLPRLSFPHLATFLDSLENMQWFESELDLCLQGAAMRVLRLLATTGSVESFAIAECKMKALKISFSEVLKDCEDEKRQNEKEQNSEKSGQKLKNIISHLIDLRTTEVFTNPLASFIRCIMSEYFTSETSQSVQALIKADVAKAAYELRSKNSFAFLETMQSKSLISKVHDSVFRLYKRFISSTNSNEELILLRSLCNLTRSCLIHRLPMPCEPCLLVLCMVSDEIGRCLKIANYPQWNAMFKPSECIFLFESITKNSFENADMLREMLIQRL